MGWARAVSIWGALAAVVLIPLAIAAQSPLLAWRDPIYIAAGLTGVVGLCVLLIQPLLAHGLLPGVSPRPARVIHRWFGASLLCLVVAHVVGLWLTSPPDVVDALLFVSPTPFSAWGVVAMWGIFLTGLLALFRRRLKIHPRHWRRGHTALACVIVWGTGIHAILIEGTMGPWSKALLVVCAVGATTYVAFMAWVTSARPRAD